MIEQIIYDQHSNTINFNNINMNINMMNISINSMNSIAGTHTNSYQSSGNLGSLYSVGGLLLVMYVCNVITGLLLASQMDTSETLNMVNNSMANLNFSIMVVQHAHGYGVSVIFLLTYAHIWKSIVANGSCNNQVKVSGVALFVLLFIIAFTGYVVVGGNMGYWAGVVILNLLQSIPCILWAIFSHVVYVCGGTHMVPMVGAIQSGNSGTSTPQGFGWTAKWTSGPALTEKNLALLPSKEKGASSDSCAATVGSCHKPSANGLSCSATIKPTPAHTGPNADGSMCPAQSVWGKHIQGMINALADGADKAPGSSTLTSLNFSTFVFIGGLCTLIIMWKVFPWNLIIINTRHFKVMFPVMGWFITIVVEALMSNPLTFLLTLNMLYNMNSVYVFFMVLHSLLKLFTPVITKLSYNLMIITIQGIKYCWKVYIFDASIILPMVGAVPYSMHFHFNNNNMNGQHTLVTLLGSLAACMLLLGAACVYVLLHLNGVLMIDMNMNDLGIGDMLNYYYDIVFNSSDTSSSADSTPTAPSDSPTFGGENAIPASPSDNTSNSNSNGNNSSPNYLNQHNLNQLNNQNNANVNNGNPSVHTPMWGHSQSGTSTTVGSGPTYSTHSTGTSSGKEA